MHITIITGSHRPEGQSGRVGRYLQKEVEADGHTTTLIDLSAEEIPFWDEGMWGAEGLKDKWEKAWQPHAANLEKSDGIIVVSPEYHGMVSAKLKNFLLLAGHAQGPLAHKAGMIVAVSASINGAYPVAELRSHGVKNNRLCWTPEHIIVRSAADMLQDGEPANEHDANLRERITFALGVLYEYANALKEVRKSGKVIDERFVNGM